MPIRVSIGVGALAACLAMAAPALANPILTQSAKRACLMSPSDTVALTKPVAAGDDLIALVGGQGWGAPASSATGMSDNVNGAWKPLTVTNSVTNDGADYLTYAVYHLVGSHAASNGLIVSVNTTQGQSSPDVIVLDVSGGIEDKRAFQTSVQTSASGELKSPAVTTAAGDLALGLFGPYQDSEWMAAGSRWTQIGKATDCSAVLAEQQTESSGASTHAVVNGGASTIYIGGILTLTSGAVSPPGPPSNTSSPVVTGTAAQGQTLTTGKGSWSNSPTWYSYGWEDCDTSGNSCRTRTGASSSTYTLQASDVGSTIRSVVTATNAGGSASAGSAPTAVVSAKSSPPPPPPANTSPPTTAGTAQQSQTLTAGTGTWTNSPTSYAYRWQDCTSSGCSEIAGASGQTYTLQASDVGKKIDVAVTASNAGGSGSATSAQTGPVSGSNGGGGGTPPTGLHVAGNQVLDASGNVVHLHGVNRSGTEYACIQGTGIFDGPSDAASVAAIRSWNANIVRVPLNEDCWLGINGVPAAYAGQNYIKAVVNYVNLLHQQGMYAELSLMWGAPGSYQATYQPGSPDEDHSPAMWASLAQTFKNDPNVILAPWGETVVDANCFLNGGVCEATYGNSSTPYNTAGMQQAVSVMRQNGYHGVISIPGIDYANDMSQWLSHIPSDPDNQLVAEMHIYGKNTCDTTSCLNSTVAPILQAGHPVIFGETGETYDDSDPGTSYISTFLSWADQHGVGYEPWTWDTWGTYGSLISDYSGTPYGNYGSYVKSHFATLP